MDQSHQTEVEKVGRKEEGGGRMVPVGGGA